MATPNFLLAEQLMPTQRGIGAALSSGLQTYGDIQKARQATSLAEEEKAKAQALPSELKTKQQTADLALKQQQLITGAMPTDIQQAQKLASYNLAAKRLSNDQLKHDYYNNLMSEVNSYPKAQRPEAYQMFLRHAEQLGEDVSGLPHKYNDQVQAQLDVATKKSPVDKEERELQLKVAIAEMNSRAKLATTPAAEVAEAQRQAADNIHKYGLKDMRTITSLSHLAKLSGYTPPPAGTQGQPTPTTVGAQPGVQSQPPATAPATPMQPQGAAPAAPTAQAQAPSVSPAAATAVAPTLQLGATPSEQATPPAQSITQPDQQAAQIIKPEYQNQSKPIANKLAANNDAAVAALNAVSQKAVKLTPFQIAQQNALSKSWTKINESAQVANEQELPLYKTLLSDLEQTNLVNPITGHIAWSTPAGQKFLADLTQAQGAFIKSFHLGRMTQLEFNFLKSAIGKSTFYPSALRNVFQDVMARDHADISKALHYQKYIQGGGTNVTEVDASWAKATVDAQKEAHQQAYNDVYGIRLKGLDVTPDQLHKLASKNNLTDDQVVDMLRKAKKAGKL